jgi:hypothetical protein
MGEEDGECGLTTDQALAIVGFACQAARALGAKPLGYAVVDTGAICSRWPGTRTRGSSGPRSRRTRCGAGWPSACRAEADRGHQGLGELVRGDPGGGGWPAGPEPGRDLRARRGQLSGGRGRNQRRVFRPRSRDRAGRGSWGRVRRANDRIPPIRELAARGRFTARRSPGSARMYGAVT